MVAVETLDQEGLRELAGRTDRLGVLSVYVDADRRQDPHLRAAAIDLRNRFRELQRRVTEDSTDARSRDVAAALERLWPQVETLADPTVPGRGRIAFAALGGDWILRLESAMPVASRVVLDGGPFIHPLLELVDEGRAAGVVLASADGARLLEWRAGALRPVRELERPYVEAPHERAGQMGGGPEGQYHTPMREQRESRRRDATARFLDGVAEAAADLAGERGWERLLVSGGERWTEPVVSRFAKPLRDRVFGDSRVLDGLDDATLAEVVTGWAHEQHTERETRLLGRVRDAALSGTGALGLSEVTAALNAGRVAHLVYDPPRIRYAGTVGPDGVLYAGAELGPGGQAGTPDPRFTERLVEQALRTAASISPVEGAADGDLRDADGVAALLRW